ncbi:MAG: DUF1847 domain-containing protein [Candidatus Geothermarchaeales archaeon]
MEVPEKRLTPRCDKCPVIACWPKNPKDLLKGPQNCPMKNYPDVIKRAKDIYLDEKRDERDLQLIAARLEAISSRTPPGGTEINMALTRVEEVVQYAKMMGWKKIGIAHCIGLIGEAKILAEFLELRGFEVACVNCKMGGIEKTEIGLKEYEKVRMLSYEAICDNVAQALVLNEENTDLNIVLGLCMGHDITFSMNSKAPHTTLIVKDRRTGHNPAVPLYQGYPPCNFYYGRMRSVPSETGGR